MRYAVISDIHGNLPALEAVLRDVKGNVDGTILLGDYCCDLPWYDEIVDAIRALPNACLVRGNKEDYIENLAQQDPAAWTDGQMTALYYMMSRLSPGAISYLRSLPVERMVATEDGGYFHAFHAARHLFGGCLDHITSENFHRLREERGAGFDASPALSAGLRDDAAFRAVLDKLPDGLYLFGHNHIQWTAELHGKLLLNPGSCGLPLDSNRAAPYAVAEYRNGKWQAALRRAAYDVDETARVLRSSGLYQAAPIWCQLLLRELLLAREHVTSFLVHAEAYARRIGDPVRPFSRETWSAAFDAWEAEALL